VRRHEHPLGSRGIGRADTFQLVNKQVHVELLRKRNDLDGRKVARLSYGDLFRCAWPSLTAVSPPVGGEGKNSSRGRTRTCDPQPERSGRALAGGGGECGGCMLHLPWETCVIIAKKQMHCSDLGDTVSEKAENPDTLGRRRSRGGVEPVCGSLNPSSSAEFHVAAWRKRRSV